MAASEWGSLIIGSVSGGDGETTAHAIHGGERRAGLEGSSVDYKGAVKWEEGKARRRPMGLRALRGNAREEWRLRGQLA
ncbi:MAG: hypothetical protein AMXMBFR20_06110 [Planctomycetia bacterium]|nr:MAG: hypothetical protein B6D36_03760 [Planctomycetes bacterium UTPLA1]